MKKILNRVVKFLAALLVADLAAMLVCLNMIFIFIWTEFALLVPLGFGMCVDLDETAGPLATIALGVLGFQLCHRFYKSGGWKKYNRECLRMFYRVLSIEV